MVKAGKMRHLVTLQRRSTTQDAMGQPTETFTTIADVVCQIQSTIGREFLRASGEVSVGSHVVHTRARDDITLHAYDRILFGTRVFDIEGVSDLNEDKRLWRIAVTELTP